MIQCPVCDARVPVGTDACPKCGTNLRALAPDRTRRWGVWEYVIASIGCGVLAGVGSIFNSDVRPYIVSILSGLAVGFMLVAIIARGVDVGLHEHQRR